MTIERHFAPTPRKKPTLEPVVVSDAQWTQNQREGAALCATVQAQGIVFEADGVGLRSPYCRLSENFVACLRSDPGNRAAGVGSSLTFAVFRLVGDKAGALAYAYAVLPPLGDGPWNADRNPFGGGKIAFRGRTPRVPVKCADQPEALRAVGILAEFCRQFPEHALAP